MATQPESSQNLPKIHPTLAGNLKMVHDAVKPVIWRLQMTWGRSKDHQNATLTAFAVKANLLMTCAHGGWTTHNNLEITAKPLSRSNETYRAYVVDVKVDCDMVLVRVEGIPNMEIGKFGTGKLEVGEVIMAYGHPHDYVGSGCVGKNFYPCFANIPTNFGNLRCKNYVIDPLSSQSRFRVMGDVWNRGSIARAEKEPNIYGTNLDFEKNLLAKLPIIQAGGMVCGSGASGAPIFNFDSEIVGMHVYDINGYEIGIHVSGLQAFLERYLAKQSGGGGEDQGGGGGKPVKEAYGKGKAPFKNRKRRHH